MSWPQAFFYTSCVVCITVFAIIVVGKLVLKQEKLIAKRIIRTACASLGYRPDKNDILEAIDKLE